MLRYVTASTVHAPVPTESQHLDDAFRRTYERKLEGCGFDDLKKKQLTANLHDTANRICDPSVPVRTSATTWWANARVLCFDPSKVDARHIMTEQRASLAVMHQATKHSRIHVFLDLSAMTLMTAMRTTHRASYHNLVDGLRLWSTIPHSIDGIHIVKPKDAAFQWLYDLIVPRVLSAKLQARLRVWKSSEEVMRHINALEADAARASGDRVDALGNGSRS